MRLNKFFHNPLVVASKSLSVKEVFRSIPSAASLFRKVIIGEKFLIRLILFDLVYTSLSPMGAVLYNILKKIFFSAYK